MTTVTPKRNPAVHGQPLPTIPTGITHKAADGTETPLQTVPVPNRKQRRAGHHGRPSTRQQARDQKWAHTCLLMAASCPPDLNESVDTYTAKIRKLALREWRAVKRMSRRRVRLARSHGKKLGRPAGRRFPVPSGGRPSNAG